ncbi:salt tolerance down-regulator-domain-containing protein [Gilbertella persicaria]|uniref:salt tolerance down-regulator-domain-containing protein n=1 Tax=Gilbertella persicaria TaxID=101096 RepID=UPI002220F294|nr:salt tolerance down-regulator-domain-containing protein [Gilbertella persicaria]KAI8090182.1 salt tolerance down-regulator-domain-containing protein [Gilbertella persicaria]
MMRHAPCATVVKKGNITIIKRTERTHDVWNSANYTEERQRIREFWLQLSEGERRSLVKVEKEAVLRKMKEQQKHSCNCSVCGKKRTAIEDELEVLYNTYYKDLEQYAYCQQKLKEADSDDDTASFHSDSTKSIETDEFSNTLTVQGSVITVADDLLKNDGKKFLDMMDELAERKSLKEKQGIENDSSSSSEEDEEEHLEEEGEEEAVQDTRTEEQRMEEGRKMFQVFAARMFEQRVLNAYREKVAQDRQRRLIEELEEEDRQRQERELKKQQDKEKKRDKRRQLKEQQEKERLELENKKKQEEARKEQERLRKEEERKKKRLKAAEKERKRKEEEEEEKKRMKSTEEQQVLPTRQQSFMGPIGSPIKSKPYLSHIASDAEHHYSFFSNFLFGQPINDPSGFILAGEDTHWTNGWTPLTTLSDTVHNKLFGDVLDKKSIVLERAQVAYMKLNQLAQAKLCLVPNYHPLVQLHDTYKWV